jgi:hypothetical protein
LFTPNPYAYYARVVALLNPFLRKAGPVCIPAPWSIRHCRPSVKCRRECRGRRDVRSLGENVTLYPGLCDR